MEALQELFLGAVLIPGHVQRQHGQKGPGGSHVVGPLHIGGHVGEDFLLEQLEVSLPIPGGDAVLELGRQVPELLRPAGRHGVRHGLEVPEEVALDVLGGVEVHVGLQKLQDVRPHPVGGGPVIGVAEQGEEGPAEAGAGFELALEEVQKLALVHPQHLQQAAHLLRDAGAEAGGDDDALPPREDAGEAVRQAGGVPQPLEEGLEIGVIADSAVPLQVAVLLFRPPVGADDLAGVGDILDLRVVRGNRDVPVDCGLVITGYRIGGAEQIGHS